MATMSRRANGTLMARRSDLMTTETMFCLVRSSRLGLTWADGGRVGCCPQVKRASPTCSGAAGSGTAGLWRLGAAGLDDFKGEVLEFAEQGAEFLRVVEQGLVFGEFRG